jgi:spore germination protein
VRYIVRYRDTLGSIASRFGVSVNAIMRANGLRHYYIHPGQVLWIPVHYPQYGHGHPQYGQQHPYYPGQQHPYYPGDQHGGQHR